MLKFEKIDHVTVNYPQGGEAVSLDFYRNILQLEEIPSLVAKAKWFKMGGIELHVSPGDIENKLSSRHAAFVVSNLDAAKQYLEDKGVAIQYSDDIEGRKRFFFRDPFGNRFELVEYI